MSRPRVALVTVVSGRHDHLAAQQVSVAAGDTVPDDVVVVAMGDPAVNGVVGSSPLATRTSVVSLDVASAGRLPLARARNVGAARAADLGAELLVFLDVDCLAGPALVSSYVEAVRVLDAQVLDGQGVDARVVDVRGTTGVLGGPVAYLPPRPAGTAHYDAATIAATPPHPARPAPPPGVLVPAEGTRLFWSLSFAVRTDAWERYGGFDEGYTGYGGEDTDFGQRVAAAGGRLWWVGGALAHHQWHPVSDPPVEHLDDIVRNANRFADRWGWFPMEGWLTAFADRGLARHDPGSDRWVAAGDESRSAR